MELRWNWDGIGMELGWNWDGISMKLGLDCDYVCRFGHSHLTSDGGLGIPHWGDITIISGIKLNLDEVGLM